MQTPLVVLSPHFDDAALAVGALIADHVGAGSPVEVLSVYTDGPPVESLSGKQRVFGDYATRSAEDDRALALLGAQGRRLGLRERLFRDPPLPNPAHLFRTPDETSGFSELTAIQEVVAAVLAEPNARLLAPLGVGNHVDHVEVAVATMRAAVEANALDRVSFYEDFNALSECWRRRHPVTRSAPRRWRDAPGWASPWAGVKMESMSLVSRGPSSTDYLSPGDHLSTARPLADHPLSDHRAQPPGWSYRVAPVGAREAAKLAAVREYQTQTKVLGGERQIVAMIRRSHSRRGGEVLWELTQGG